METTKKPKRTINRNHHSALDKARAVLSVWTERRKASEVCQELDVQWNILTIWQHRAMEGMLQALEPRVNLEKGPALSPRLQRMLDRKHQVLVKPGPSGSRLEDKLVKIQANRTAKKAEATKK
jgi:transposase-like protein